MESPLATFAGNAVYLDTMIPYMFLRGVAPSAKAFFARLEHGELRAYTSVLTFDELGYRLLLAFVKDRYGGSALEHLRNAEEKMFAEFAPAVTNLIRQMRGYAALTILDVLASDLSLMADTMTQFHLRPRDALHYAAMVRVGCFNLASNDPHFDRIPTITRYA